MARRAATGLGIALALAAAVVVCVVAWRIIRGNRSVPGHVVRVSVHDEEGRPVPGAQVQARFAPGWRPVASDGTVRLEGVLLRAADVPGPQTIAGAVEASAPYHALPPGPGPVATRAADGTWEVDLRLRRHGVLRLIVDATVLRGVRASIEVDDPTLVEAIDGSDVARSGQPASWRVYPGLDRITVHLLGDEGTAASQRVEPPPSPGFTREIVLEPKPAVPIRGRLVARTDPTPPTLVGQVDVFEITDDGAQVPYDPVVIEPDGSFRVPYAGARLYELTARPGFAPAATPVRIRGGETIEIPLTRARPWAEVDLEAWPEALESGRVTVADTATGNEAHIPHGAVAYGTSVLVALPGPGRFHVRVTTLGSVSGPPRAGEATFEAQNAGRHAVRITPETVPHGTLILRRTPDDDGAAAITVRAAEGEDPRTRTASLLPGFDEVTVPNVRAGRCTVEIRWRGGRGDTTQTVEVPEGDTVHLVLEAPAAPPRGD